MSSASILEVRGLSKSYKTEPGLVDRVLDKVSGSPDALGVRALDHIDLEVRRGEVLALVGESGCGKSTLGRMAAFIERPSAGTVEFNGKPFGGKGSRPPVQMVFQDSMAALNPVMTLSEAISEAPVVLGKIDRKSARDHAAALLAEVGLDPELQDRLPRQLSGGQRQRACIARALAVDPELLVCDESVSALDVSVQAQVLNMFMRLREERQLTYLFISHDLGVVRHISDRVAIMYLGRIVELADTKSLFSDAAHPYTRALIAEIPRIRNGRKTFAAATGEVPSPLSPPSGCHFHPRCPLAIEKCRVEAPKLLPRSATQQVACHVVQQ